nr:hypothetical protein [Gammaproteobacteria bacterium]
FDAFDAAGAPIGAPVVGFHENGSFAGQTSDDRFYGVVYEQGISAIQIRSLATAGMELDHLQYGRADIQAPPPPPVGTVSAPHSAALLALGLSAFGVLRIKPRIRKRV